MKVTNFFKNTKSRSLIVRCASALVAVAFLLANHVCAADERVALKTDLGTVVIELYVKEAPITVANFLEYVDSKFYDGTIFHRVVPGFVVQGGGMTFDFANKPTRDAIKNESANGLGNKYKTVAMARTARPDSATSQFYINLQDNNALDGSAEKPGYTVFGKVVEGMDVVEKIAAEPRGMHRAFPEAPDYAVRILNAFRVDATFKPEESAQPTVKNPLKNSNVSDALVKP
jgi:peptidyl-prolyl cis-trans isomerase A (cyclophilin A)